MTVIVHGSVSVSKLKLAAPDINWWLFMKARASSICSLLGFSVVLGDASTGLTFLGATLTLLFFGTLHAPTLSIPHPIL